MPFGNECEFLDTRSWICPDRLLLPGIVLRFFRIDTAILFGISFGFSFLDIV